MSDHVELWQEADSQLSKDQWKRVGAFRDWLRASDIPVAVFLADPDPAFCEVKFSDDQMRKLQRKIIDESTSLSSAHRDLQILGKIVFRWNSKAEPKLLQPRLSHLFSLPNNPFAKGLGKDSTLKESLEMVQAWLRVEKKWIEDCKGESPLELIVLSALLHGGLLQNSSILHLINALFSVDTSAGYTSFGLYVDLSLPWRGHPAMEYRKWYPDAQTGSMILPPSQIPAVGKTFGAKWNGTDLNGMSEAQITARVFSRIRRKMRQSKLKERLLPRSLPQMLDSVAACALLDVPAVLVEYASRQLVSHSLKPSVLKRLYGQAEESVTSSRSYARVEAGHDIPDGNEDQDDIEPTGLIELREALRGDSGSVAQARLEDLLDKTEASGKSKTGKLFWSLLADFSHYLLTRRKIQRFGRTSQKLLKLSSVKKYSFIVGRRLGRQLGDENLLDFNPLNVVTAYTKVMENLAEQDASIRIRRTVSSALREFHHYLENEHQVPGIDRDVLGTEGGRLPVDANVITLEEYQTTRGYLAELARASAQCKENEARILIAADVMLILGFRCGTRRMEAHGLRMSDLVERGTPWLIIRPTDERRLKTPNATRQLPLKALLPRKELQTVLKWKERREAEGATPVSPLFGETAEDKRFINVERLISLIHDALRYATNDGTVHFHHLRHSCATWMFLRLMLSDLPAVPPLFPHLPATSACLKKSRSFRILLYGRGTPTRQHALSVAALLGHSSHRISLENYVHCLDWLLPLFLEQSGFLGVPTTSRIVKASAFDQSSVYSWEQERKTSVSVSHSTPKAIEEERERKDRTPGWSAGAPVEIFKRRFPHLVANFERQLSASPGAGAAQLTWLDLASDALRGEHSLLQELERILGTAVATPNLLLRRAEDISRIVVPRGKKVPRHRFVFMPDPQAPEKRIAFPPRPKSLNDVEDLIPKVRAEFDTDCRALRQVLGYYVNNVWQNATYLPFRDPDSPDDAIRYVRFLRSLGIENGDIWLGSYHELQRSRWRRKWIDVFEREFHHRFEIERLPWRFKQKSLESRQSASTSKMLLIEPVLGRHRGGSEAFRFLITMAAIVFGYD